VIESCGDKRDGHSSGNSTWSVNKYWPGICTDDRQDGINSR